MLKSDMLENIRWKTVANPPKTDEQKREAKRKKREMQRALERGNLVKYGPITPKTK